MVSKAMDTHATIEVLLETVFSTQSVQMGYKETTEARSGSWKGAAIQRGLEPSSTGIATASSCYQATTSEDITGWKRISVNL
jgi:hypothetical protein